MSDCLKIYPKSNPDNVPSDLLDNNNNIFIDLPSGFELSLSKSRSEYSEFTGLKTDGALGFSLPRSKNNNLLLSNQINPLSDKEITGLDVHTKINSKFLGEDVLCVLKKTHENYDVELQKGSTHWKTALDKCTICDALDENDTFELTLNNLQSNWSNPTTSLAYFPVVNYGSWVEDGQVSCEDLRPFININLLLERLFCKAGWNYKSNLLSETIYGNSLIAYLLKKDFYNYTGQGNLFNIQASTVGSTIFTLSQVIPFTNDSTLGNFDNGNNFNTSTFEYIHSDLISTSMEFCLNVDACIQGNDDRASITVTLLHTDSTNTFIDSQVQNGINLDGQDECFIFNMCKKFTLNQGDKVYARIEHTSNPISGNGFLNSATLTGRVCDKRIYKGDVLPLKEMLNCEITGLDFVGAIVQAYNLKVTEDRLTKTVCLDLPCDWITPHNETVTGYFLDDVIDWNEKVICETAIFSSPKDKVFENCRLQWKNSTDDYIAEQEFPEDSPLWSRTVNLGGGQLSEPDVKSNKLFEPTLDGIDTNISEGGVSIPFMWDNTDDKTSTDINPRILYAYGLVEQYNNGATAANVINIEGTDETLFPFASQCTDTQNSSGISANVVFGQKENDLYNLGWAKELLEKTYGFTISFQLLMTFKEYCDKDFFKKIHQVFYDGRTYFLRALEVNNHRPCSKSPTEVIFVTIPQQQLCATEIELCDISYPINAPAGNSAFPFVIMYGDNSCQLLPFSSPTIDLENCIANILTANNVVFSSINVTTLSTDNLFDSINIEILGTNLDTTQVSVAYGEFGISTAVNSCDPPVTVSTCDYNLAVLSGGANIISILLDGSFICVAPAGNPYDVTDWNTVLTCLQNGLTAAGYVYGNISYSPNGTQYQIIMIEDTNLQGGDLVIQMTSATSVQITNCT